LSSGGGQGARFSKLLADFMAAIHRHSQGETLHLLSEQAITLPQMVAMQHLHYSGEASVSMLQETLRLSPSATSHLVDRLVERGFVTRSEDAEDRRQKRIQITRLGQALIDRLARSRVQELDDAVAALEPALRDQLFGVLEQVVDRLKETKNPREPE
jgi:DNA-binding MarR family transcriptional regulator